MHRAQQRLRLVSRCRLRVYDVPPEAISTCGLASGAADAAAQQQRQREQQGQKPEPDPFWPALRVAAGELIYDFDWFAAMSASDPGSCCFAVATRGHPVHLWDACSGQLRCSYRPYNAVDEPTAAYSLAFSPGE